MFLDKESFFLYEQLIQLLKNTKMTKHTFQAADVIDLKTTTSSLQSTLQEILQTNPELQGNNPEIFIVLGTLRPLFIRILKGYVNLRLAKFV